MNVFKQDGISVIFLPSKCTEKNIYAMKKFVDVNSE
jgi:hypothetical protein